MAGSKLFKYLPKPTSFSIPTAGAGAAPYRAAFSGPINISIVPKEARRKTKKRNEEPDFDEPTSPKVSCIGQVKKKKIVKNKKEKKEIKKYQEVDEKKKKKIKKINKSSTMQSFFTRKVRSTAYPEVEVEEPAVAVAVAPEIGMMRKFRSGRETLGDFDWRKEIANIESEEEEEDEVLVPHSAPILMGGGVVAAERKKKEEVNLWKRRTLSPPKPLQVY